MTIYNLDSFFSNVLIVFYLDYLILRINELISFFRLRRFRKWMICGGVNKIHDPYIWGSCCTWRKKCAPYLERTAVKVLTQLTQYAKLNNYLHYFVKRYKYFMNLQILQIPAYSNEVSIVYIKKKQCRFVKRRVLGKFLRM